MAPKILERPALVLNRNWQPVNVTTVARALVLLWNESARVVDTNSFQLYNWEDWAGFLESFIHAAFSKLLFATASGNLLRLEENGAQSDSGADSNSIARPMRHSPPGRLMR